MGLAPHLKQIGARLAQAAATVLFVFVIVFVLVRVVPGTPITGLVGATSTEQAIAAMNHELHLDDPWWSQFFHYAWGLLHGDLGHSIIYRGRPVTQMIGSQLWPSVALILTTLIGSAIVGTALGLWAALTPRRWIDALIRGSFTVMLATPTFFAGLILILVFALKLHLLPVGGWGGGIGNEAKDLVLPSVSLGLFLVPFIARTIRQAGLDVKRSDFVEAAIGRGLSPWQVATRHVLPNSLLPLVTLIALNLGTLITGAVIVEAVFDFPGVGHVLVQAVQQRDYPVIQGVSLFAAVCVVVANLIADVLYAVIDPRTRR
ncbi:MAG TPA: ABC transporter permease [Solirubrobacteraceae bacterium]|nr:ABC transporter permease [Solirubrobacteraceae bacterium]